MITGIECSNTNPIPVWLPFTSIPSHSFTSITCLYTFTNKLTSYCLVSTERQLELSNLWSTEVNLKWLSCLFMALLKIMSKTLLGCDLVPAEISVLWIRFTEIGGILSHQISWDTPGLTIQDFEVFMTISGWAVYDV